MSRVYVALDIEATGLSVDRDAIIEISRIEPPRSWGDRGGNGALTT